MGSAIASTVLAVVGAAVLALFAGQAGADPRPPPAPVYVPLPSDAPSRGPSDAKVTVVEFADFQCPYCGRVTPTLERILKTNDDVRLVFRNRPLPDLHPNAERAAEAAMAANMQGKFWPMYEKLFANQEKLEKSDLEGYARDVGLDMKAFEADIASGKAKARVAQDLSEARRLDAHGTPTFFINGVRFGGAQSFGKFQDAIDRERDRAEAALKSGTPRNKLYDALMGRPASAP